MAYQEFTDAQPIGQIAYRSIAAHVGFTNPVDTWAALLFLLREKLMVAANDPGMNEPRYFQGVFAHRFLFEYVESGKITIPEAWLWMNISTFQKGGKRCFMSNEALGKRANVEERQARRYLTNLIDMGLVVRIFTDPNDNSSRVLIAKMPSEYAVGTVADVQTPLQSMTTPSGQKCPHNTTTLNKTLSTPSASTDSDPRYTRFARRLADAIAQCKKINCTSKLAAWAKSIQHVHTLDGVDNARLKKALYWYCDALPTMYGTSYFLDIQSGASFRDKFTRVEAAMNRALNKPVDRFNTPPSKVKRAPGETPWVSRGPVTELS